MLNFSFPQAVEVAISIDSYCFIVSQEEGDMGFITGLQNLTLTTVFGLDIDPLDEMLRKHRMIYRTHIDMDCTIFMKFTVVRNSGLSWDQRKITNVTVVFVEIVDRRAACMQPVEQLTGYRNGAYCSPKDNTTNFYLNSMPKGKRVIETDYYIDRTGTYQTGTCSAQCAYSPEFSATGRDTHSWNR